jgi:nucleoside 2-deoxyribosyltransferase
MNHKYPGELAGKMVYLAGPFFGLGQRWLIDEARRILNEFYFRVFSPVHDVGLNVAEVVAAQDVQGIEECNVVFAIVEEWDPGTIFEIGYARRGVFRGKQKRVVIYSPKQPRSHEFTMMRGLQCEIYNDFGSAIYNLIWGELV